MSGFTGDTRQRQAARRVRGILERGSRPSRRATPGVEVVEARVSLSSFTLSQRGVVSGVEDLNRPVCRCLASASRSAVLEVL